MMPLQNNPKSVKICAFVETVPELDGQNWWNNSALWCATKSKEVQL